MSCSSELMLGNAGTCGGGDPLEDEVADLGEMCGEMYGDALLGSGIP